MAAIRGVLAILAGVFLAAVIGGAYDYLKLSFIPNPVEWTFIWPYVFAAAGAIAAVTAVLLYARWQGNAESGAERPRKPVKAKAARPKSDKTSGISTSSEIPGMPTFDVDKLKTEGAKKEQTKK